MELKALIAECTAYDFKEMLEEKKPKSWLKSVSAFANGLGGSLFFGIDNGGLVKAADRVIALLRNKSVYYKNVRYLCNCQLRVGYLNYAQNNDLRPHSQ